MSQRNHMQVIHMLPLLYKNLKNKSIHLYTNTYCISEECNENDGISIMEQWLVNEEQMCPRR